MDKPIFIVPQLILYKAAPEKEHPSLLDIFFGFRDKPGIIRKIVLFFRHNRRAFIDFGTPLNLKVYMEAQGPDKSLEQMAIDIRQMLVDRIDKQKRIILGPVMKSVQQQKEIVLKDPHIIEDIEEKSAGDKKKLKQLKKTAGDYFDEIAADYNQGYIEFAYVGLTWPLEEDVRRDQRGALRTRGGPGTRKEGLDCLHTVP